MPPPSVEKEDFGGMVSKPALESQQAEEAAPAHEG